jgi:hypothetical protein
MNQELLTKVQVISQEIGEEVSLEMVAKMVKNHHDKMGAKESQVFSIAKSEVEKILNQPGCVSITFKEAINEEGDKTWVYAGFNAKGKCLVEVVAIDNKGKLDVQKGKFGVIPVIKATHEEPIILPFW